MLMLSELGLPGFALLVCFLVATTVAAVRSRRRSRSAAILVAGSLTVGAYWLVQSSYDWFWHYPGVTAPVMFLLGAAAVPALPVAAGALRRSRLLLLAPLAVLVVLAVPLFLAVGYVDRALDIWPTEPSAAYADLDDAASLNPYEFEPVLIKGAIAERRGEDRLAIESFEKAAGRVPESYAAHYFIARLVADSEPARARAEAARAHELNPLEPKVIVLQRKLAKERVRQRATSKGG
jgi:tetratricopeptide (TPR) repeat protein